MNVSETMEMKSTSAASPMSCDHGWRSQFANPRGFWGHVVGSLMAMKNAPMNRLAVELLDLEPDHTVLEIGYGPGTAIEWAAAQVNAGRVVGIDRSITMLEQATRRNRKAIDAGRVELHQGEASALPFPDQHFDRVFAVNNYHIWKTRDRELAEIRRVLMPNGMLLLALRMEHPRRSRMAAPGLTEEQVHEAAARLKEAGFVGVEIDKRKVGREVSFVTARLL